MSIEEPSAEHVADLRIDPRASRLIILAMLGLLAAGLHRLSGAEQTGWPASAGGGKGPPARPRACHLSARCVTCHGTDGRGDGPLAAQLIGPPVGNLTDDVWKHGDRPEQVLSVIGQGVPNTRMDGWSRVFDPPELKAVAAYVYFLAKHPVPEEIRRP